MGKLGNRTNKAGYTAINSRTAGRERICENQLQFKNVIPGDQPELSKCMMVLLLKYKRELVGDGLELKKMAERLLI